MIIYCIFFFKFFEQEILYNYHNKIKQSLPYFNFEKCSKKNTLLYLYVLIIHNGVRMPKLDFWIMIFVRIRTIMYTSRINSSSFTCTRQYLPVYNNFKFQ